MALKLVPPAQPPTPARCHYKLAHQQGRGGNRKAVYVCRVHVPAYACGILGFRGWTNKK